MPPSRALFAGLLAALTASCLAAAPEPAPTATVLPSPSAPTATVAFPTLIPTASWTPRSTPTVTPDPQAGVGAVLFHDVFDDPDPWILLPSSSGGASLTQGRLTLSVRSPREYYWSVRPSPTAADFYAAVEIHTQVCNPGDEFGLMARFNAAGEHYRFLIACDGTARITRFLEAGSRALTLRVDTPVIIPGAPSLNRMAVRARGLDLTLLVNGQEVVHVRDAALSAGAFGLIARAGPGGQVTVGFDNLVVHELGQPGPAVTATITPAP